MDNKIFFSYSRKDSKFVDQLAADLETRGYDVWIDRGDIIAGGAWRDQIVEAIKTCSVFFLVLSSNSTISANVNRELTLAERHNKTIIPIFLEQIDIPDSMAYQLAGLQQLDFSTGKYENHLQILINALEKRGFSAQKQDEGSNSGAGSPRTEAKPSKLPAKQKNTLSKIPLLGWVGGGAILLLLVIFGINNLTSNKNADPVETLAVADNPTNTLEIPAVVDEPTPTNTLIPPTQLPTATPSPTETAIPSETPVPPTPTITDTPTNTPIPVLISDEAGVEMVFVPAGEFTMGSIFGDADAPAYKVNLDAFYIDKYEVSVENYKKWIDLGGGSFPSSMSSITHPNDYFNNDEFANYPVIYVSWSQAKEYCNWRAARLPTEVEWEKAAKGAGNQDYPWGGTDPDCGLANFQPTSTCIGDTTEVDAYPEGTSPYGVYNMAGNVAEWVDATYKAYPIPNVDLFASSDFNKGYIVVRGGSFFDGPTRIETTYRNYVKLEVGLYSVGFRCVRDFEP